MIKISEFEQQVVIQSIVKSKDAAGGLVETPSTLVTIWALVEESQNEAVTLSAMHGVNSITITTHRRADVTTTHVAVYNGQMYNITGVTNVDRIYMKLEATLQNG